MIKPSKICSGYDLFIHITMVVTASSETNPLIPFCGPIYIALIRRQIVRYMYSMSTYGLCTNYFNIPPP